MSGLLTGRVALVTGGAQGIGRAIALACAREGAAVAIGDINDDGRAVAAEIGARALFQRTDVRDAVQVKALVAAAKEKFGAPDAVFANAGIEGPLGAETALRFAASGKVQGVVAMTHDQGTIASKLLDWGDAVNVICGRGGVTVSVTSFVVLPPMPVAVSV